MNVSFFTINSKNVNKETLKVVPMLVKNNQNAEFVHGSYTAFKEYCSLYFLLNS